MNRVTSILLIPVLVVSAGGLFIAPIAAQTQESGQVIGQPQLSFATSSGELSPGATGDVRIGITNRGQLTKGGPEQYETRVTTARGLTLSVDDSEIPLSVDTGQLALGNVPTGATQAGPISITVPTTAEPGTYEIPIKYTYQYSRIADYDRFGVEYSEFTRSRTTTIEVQIGSESRFEVVSSSGTVQIGETNDIAITLRNTGDRPAGEASVRVASPSGELSFGNTPASTAYVGSWKPNETHTVIYSPSLADDAPERNYALNVAVEYTDVDGIAQSSRSLATGVTAQPEQTFTLQDSSGSLRVGETGRVQATIRNDGPQPIQDPVITLSANNNNININTDEVAVDNLQPGQQTTAKFSIDVSDGAEVTTQRFQMEVNYTDERNDQQSSDTLQTNIRIQPRRNSFIVTPLNSSLQAGEQTTFALRVTNNRGEPLSQIDAKAFFDGPLSSADDEAFIGSLSPNESTTIVVDLSASSEALEKTYSFSIDFQYELPDESTELSKTYNVPVAIVQPSESSFSLIGLAGTGVLAVIIGIAVAWRWRR